MSIYSVGPALRLLRTERELSQREAGKRIGVVAATIRNWERGKVLPREETLKEYLKALRTTPREFSVFQMRAIFRNRKLSRSELLRLHFLFGERVRNIRIRMSRQKDAFSPEDFELLDQQLRDNQSLMVRQIRWLEQIEAVVDRHLSRSSASNSKRQGRSTMKSRGKSRAADRYRDMDHVSEALSLLRKKIMDQRVTYKEIQENLGWGRTYLSQLLGGNKALRLDQIVSIGKEIGVEPREFFAELYDLVPSEMAI